MICFFPLKIEAASHIFFFFSKIAFISLQQLADPVDKVENDEVIVDESIASIAPNVLKKADKNLFEDETAINKNLEDQSQKKDEGEVIVRLNTESSIVEKTPIAPPDERNITVTAIKNEDDTNVETSKEKDVKIDETNAITQIEKSNPNDCKEENVLHVDNDPNVSNDQADLIPKEVDLQDEIVYYDQVLKSTKS